MRAGVCAAASRRTAATSGSWRADTTTASGLMMPDFTDAISTRVSPRRSVWSRPTGVKTATSPSAVLVESHAPPIPTSTTATSTGASEKATKARTVSSSKNVSGASPASASCASTRATNGAISSQAATTAASAIGSPSTTMRSVNRMRCGLVNRPVRNPRLRSRLSMRRAVEVLPLVPVMWITRYVRCGSSRYSSRRRVRSMRGSTHCSPWRVSSSA